METGFPCIPTNKPFNSKNWNINSLPLAATLFLVNWFGEFGVQSR